MNETTHTSHPSSDTSLFFSPHEGLLYQKIVSPCSQIMAAKHNFKMENSTFTAIKRKEQPPSHFPNLILICPQASLLLSLLLL
jgi:hypothetical protein